MNKRLHRINNYRFTIRLCKIAETYGFKTVGKFWDFLDNIPNPNARLTFRTRHTRVDKLKNELDKYLKEL